jgi:23S rRNA (cytidine1920-2'-O)/16S rRNA (cytidine1409-2'-O)-methyltransferase
MKKKLIRLDAYLTGMKYTDSRTTAQRYISEGRVSVNGIKIKKPASLVEQGSAIMIDAPEKEWVSRGAYKLIKGLDTFKVDVKEAYCVDVGASTGGFTDVLISRGAKVVYAVDVGYGQLAWKLRNDTRVITLERTNARFLTLEMIGGEKADIIVSDASFISLRLILPQMERLLKERGRMVVLVKPQFEVGKDRTNRGVVKKPALHVEALSSLAQFIEEKTSLALLDATFSPIKGPEGNIEFLFLLGFKKEEEESKTFDFANLVNKAHLSFSES